MTISTLRAASHSAVTSEGTVKEKAAGTINPATNKIQVWCCVFVSIVERLKPSALPIIESFSKLALVCAAVVLKLLEGNLTPAVRNDMPRTRSRLDRIEPRIEP